MKPRNYFLFGLAVSLLMAAAVGLYLVNRNYTYQGSQYEPPLPAVEASLTDQTGSPFSLADFSGKDGNGKLALIFFGYTNCPDVCPLTLAEFRQVKGLLGDKADQVNFVLVTVDPERDSPERLQSYLVNFDPQFIGLTGSEADMNPVWEHYGVYRAKQDSGSAAGYTMDHSARIYLVDAKGNLLFTYAYGTDVEALSRDVLHLIGEL